MEGNVRGSSFFAISEIEGDRFACEIDVRPAQRQDLTIDAPAGEVRELHDRLQRGAEGVLDGAKLIELENPLADVPFRRAKYGACMNLSLSIARLKMRRSRVSCG